MLTGCVCPGKMALEAGARRSRLEGGPLSACLWGDFKEKHVIGFFLGFIFTQPLSEKVLVELSTKDICKKVKTIEKEKQDQGTIPSEAQGCSPNPTGKDFSLSLPLG